MCASVAVAVAVSVSLLVFIVVVVALSIGKQINNVSSHASLSRYRSGEINPERGGRWEGGIATRLRFEN